MVSDFQSSLNPLNSLNSLNSQSVRAVWAIRAVWAEWAVQGLYYKHYFRAFFEKLWREGEKLIYSETFWGNLNHICFFWEMWSGCEVFWEREKSVIPLRTNNTSGGQTENGTAGNLGGIFLACHTCHMSHLPGIRGIFFVSGCLLFSNIQLKMLFSNIKLKMSMMKF